MNKKVVGMAYISNGKLLTCMSQRSSHQGKYTLVGGGVEEGETIEQAIIRESREEIGFEPQVGDFELFASFSERAASDPNLTIDMNLFIYKKEFTHIPSCINDEILKYRWYDVSEDSSNLSSSIREHLLPYAIEQGLLYSEK